jgi:hypothetical protein
MKNESNKKIRKGFIKLTGDVGLLLEEVVAILLTANENGEKVYSDFNGHILYSDLVTVENAYKKLFGMSKEEFKKKIETA